MTVLCSEEAANIGRTVAQIVRGDGWREAKASAVLADAIAGWLGRDAVQIFSFYANDCASEVFARIGNFYMSGHGIETEDEITVNCCTRHRSRFSESRLGEYSLKTGESRFLWGTPLAQRASERLAAMFTEEVDPEIARVVLGVL